jgi:lysophospholipase L1-like esterase
MSVLDGAVRVFFFGDSICFGQGVSLHKGWVARISAELSQLESADGRPVVVVNASVNGDTSRQALLRMPYDVQSHGTDVVLVQFGMNDCNYWESDRGHARVSLPAFRADLAEIAARAMTFGAKRVLLNTNHPTTRTDDPMVPGGPTYEQSNRRYNEAIRSVVAELDDARVVLNDVEAAFLEETGERHEDLGPLLLHDGLHLSERGHDLYFEVVAPAVRAAVDRALAP